MAIALLEKADFVGKKYAIPDVTGRYSKEDVQEMINLYTRPALNTLLGVELAQSMVDYYEANKTPANADLNKIINPFSFQNSDTFCGAPIYESLGLKEYLKGFVFFEYVKNGLSNTPAGVADMKAETSNVADMANTMRFAENKFNDILGTVEAIQQYCIKNSDLYPKFLGLRLKVKSSQFFC